MPLEYLSQIGPNDVYRQLESMRKFGDIQSPLLSNIGKVMSEIENARITGQQRRSLQGLPNLLRMNAPSQLIEARLASGGDIEGALRLRENRMASAMKAGKNQSESDRFKMISRLNALNVGKARLIESGYSPVSPEVQKFDKEIELIQAEIASETPDFKRAYQTYLEGSEEKKVDPAMQEDFDTVKAKIDSSIDEDKNGQIDGLDVLKSNIAEFRRKYPSYKSFADQLEESVNAKQEQAAAEKESLIKKSARGRDIKAATQDYAYKVLDQFRKNKKTQLDNLNSVGNIMSAISVTSGTALGDYNIVKAALRAVAPEAVNEGDIANIKAISQGGALATLLSKIGAKAPITDEEVSAAAKSLKSVYESSYEMVKNAIDQEVSNTDPQYRTEVKKALEGTISGLKSSIGESKSGKRSLLRIPEKGIESKSGKVRFLR